MFKLAPLSSAGDHGEETEKGKGEEGARKQEDFRTGETRKGQKKSKVKKIENGINMGD